MLSLFRRIISAGTEVASLDVTHAGKRYSVAVKRSAAARRLTLRVRTGTRDVVLTMPARSSLTVARDFVERHGAWIDARLRRLPKPVLFVPGAVIPLRGVDHVIVHRLTNRGNVRVEALEDGGLALSVAGGPEHVARRIADYLKAQARRDLEASVAYYTAAIKVPARSLTLRDTTSRWGSCSSTGSLNFSWRLIMAPNYVLDYLAAHEVAHLVHLNHSARFWKLTNSLCEDTGKAEAWLKAQGAGLHRFG